MSKLPFALAFLIAWLVAYSVIKRVALSRLKTWAGSSKAHWAPILLKALSWPADLLMLVLGLMFFIDMLGISITPLLASLGIGSLAVALALQDSLSNFFAGLYVAIDRPLETGQYVRLEGGQEGFVEDIGWRSTRIRTPAHNIIVIPNAKLMSSIITNYDLPDPEVQVPVELRVAYDSDLDKVEKVSLEVARQVQAASCGAPAFAYTRFGDSGVELTVTLRAPRFADSGPLKHEFIKRLNQRFSKEGIRVPYPTRTVLN